MAQWKTWNGPKIKALVNEAHRLGCRDAGEVVNEGAQQQVPLDEGILQNSGVVFVTRPGEPPQAFITYGGGGNTGLPVVPYAVRWHEEDANFQHGRKKRYLADPFNALAPSALTQATKVRLQAAGVGTK